MTALYNSKDNTLIEQSRMADPGICPNELDGIEKCEACKNLTVSYNAHLATLRTIPCSPECKGLWQDQRELEEGKDYEVRECRTWTQKGGEWGCAECCNKDRCDEDCDATYRRPNCPFCKGSGWFKEQPLFAFPFAPVKSEDHLWFELLRHTGMDEEYIEGWTRELKSKYIITKR